MPWFLNWKGVRGIMLGGGGLRVGGVLGGTAGLRFGVLEGGGGGCGLWRRLRCGFAGGGGGGG